VLPRGHGVLVKVQNGHAADDGKDAAVAAEDACLQLAARHPVGDRVHEGERPAAVRATQQVEAC
jgi:hypothetical protein